MRKHQLRKTMRNLKERRRVSTYCWLTLCLVVPVLFISRWGLSPQKERNEKKSIPMKWSCTTSTNAAGKSDCFQRSSSCHRTKIFPFRVGCPAVCPNNNNQTRNVPKHIRFHRVNIGWYFGQPNAFHNSSYPHVYEKGTNFQCPDVFVEHFLQASHLLTTKFQSSLSNDTKTTTTTKLIIKPQKAMHISLAYLCCLQKEQASQAVKLMSKWVQGREFDFHVSFERLECWHERQNSVTNILLLDENSQQTLFAMLRDLELYLTLHGIPIVMPRTEQMPFHITILGVQYSTIIPTTMDESDDPEDDMTPRLPDIHSIVNDLDQSMEFRGSAWTAGKELHITHKPHFSTQGTIHT